VNETPSYAALLCHGETRRDLVGALDRIADDLGFRLELKRLGRPRLGDPGPGARVRLRLQFSGEGDAFLVRPQRATEGLL
jgi:hypothetical protein